MRDAIGSDGVAERLDDGALADDLGERLGPPAAVEGLVRGGRALRRQRSRLLSIAGGRNADCRAPTVDLGVSAPTTTSGSDQAVPRHPTRFA